MPDEQSNLNLPAARRTGGNRRRGRRGGRSRSPRPLTPPTGEPGDVSAAPEAEDPSQLPLEPSASAPTAEAEVHDPDHDADPEDSRGFREPHAEEPAEFASHDTGPLESPAAEPAPEAASEPAPQASAPEPRIQPQRRPYPERRPERRPEPQRSEPQPPKPWVKPADFRPAETSAIHQAVSHATEIAESLKHMIDQLDEVLELVEVAERQKLVDERELEELRRALRRIQPPRREAQPPQTQPQQQQQPRFPRRDEPRRDESRRDELRQQQQPAHRVRPEPLPQREPARLQSQAPAAEAPAPVAEAPAAPAPTPTEESPRPTE